MDVTTLLVVVLVNQTILFSSNESIDLNGSLFVGGVEVEELFSTEFADVLVISEEPLPGFTCPLTITNESLVFDDGLVVVADGTNHSFVDVSCDSCLDELLASCYEEAACDASLVVDVQDHIVAGETIRFTPALTPPRDEFVITYSWNDLFNNTLRGPTSTTNLNPKQYTPLAFDDKAFDVVVLNVSAQTTCGFANVTKYVVVTNPGFSPEEKMIEEEVDIPDLCDTILGVRADNFFVAGETIRFTPTTSVAQEDFLLTYWFEDTTGTIVREATTTNNLNQKQFTPAQRILEQRDNVFLLRMELANACDTFFTNHTFVVVDKDFVLKQEVVEQDASVMDEQLVQEQQSVLSLVVPDILFENVSVTTSVYNDGFSGTEFYLAVYVYRHSINFSDRTPDLVIVPSGFVMNFTHEFLLEPGEYSLKAQLWLPNRRTPIEERTTIVVEESPVLRVYEQDNAVANVQNDSVVVLPPRIEQPPVTTGYVTLDTNNSFLQHLDTSLLLAFGIAGGLWLLALVMRRRNGEHEEKIL